MKNLKKLRISRGLTQKQLADALGIDRTAVAKYETGKNGATSEMLEKISDFFGVTADHLLGREQELHFATYGDDELDSKTLDEIAAFAAYARAQKNKASSKDEADRLELADLYDRLSPENKKILLAAARGLAGDK